MQKTAPEIALGVILTFIMVLMCLMLVFASDKVKISDDTLVDKIYFALFTIIAIASVIFGLSTKSRLDYLESEQSVINRYEALQKKWIVSGEAYKLLVSLEHADELLVAVSLHDFAKARDAIAFYVDNRISQRTLEGIWLKAAEIGNVLVMADFVDNNRLLNFNVKNEHGNTAAHLAVICNQKEVLKYLRVLDARKVFDFSIKNKQGYTAEMLLNPDVRDMYEIIRQDNLKIASAEDSGNKALTESVPEIPVTETAAPETSAPQTPAS
jgi:hypothetical protein